MSFLQAVRRVIMSHGQSPALNHCKSSRDPNSTAAVVDPESQSHPFCLAQRSTSMSPRLTAFAHVRVSHGQPFALAHLSRGKDPNPATLAQNKDCSMHALVDREYLTSRSAHPPPDHAVDIVTILQDNCLQLYGEIKEVSRAGVVHVQYLCINLK